MGEWQYWLEHLLLRAEPVGEFMRTAWGWPAAESVHFVGLTLLFGSIVVWDLRLLGVARGIPIGAFHRLVPFAVIGFLLNVGSGSMFLMTEPNQYLYNPAFQFKLLFLTGAGLNIVAFYTLFFRRVRLLDAGARAPAALTVIGAVSLACWIAVIICGRLITFYRPPLCAPGEPLAFIATCIIR
ncbi:MAG: hypothetical protein HYU37_05200 [Acidobacteria bacterium]|nr:hypothetical protein [Acidobacteriota bacterium]